MRAGKPACRIITAKAEAKCPQKPCLDSNIKASVSSAYDDSGGGVKVYVKLFWAKY